MKNILPKSKDDVSFFESLRLYHTNEIRETVPELLEWLQDINWPVGQQVAQYLSNYTNDIDKEIIHVLNSKDEVWKYWILSSLILHSEVKPNEKLLSHVKKIFLDPTECGIEEEVFDIAKEILEKYKIIDNEGNESK